MSDVRPPAPPASVTVAAVFGLLMMAAVPGAGYFYGQFVETIVLVIGAAALAYALFAVLHWMNGRISALERRPGDRG